MAVATAQGTAIVVPCPACGLPLLLHLGPADPQPGGRVAYDAVLARWGLNLHLRVGCEAT